MSEVKDTMLLVHRSYEEGLQIKAEDPHWIFDQVVFFVRCRTWQADDETLMGCSYSPGNAQHCYVLEVEESWIHSECLELDAKARREIMEIWETDDEDLAQSILDGSAGSEVEDEPEDGGWHVQRIRAQVARRMGYVACLDQDEQGAVYMVDFAGRNDEFNAKLRYLGTVDDED